MRPHTPDQVADMKSFVDSQPSGAERKTYALNGLEVTYTTVDMGDKKPFDYAVAAFVAPREDGQPITEDDYEIAVSSDVPEELQGIWAWHELHDFAVLGHEAEDRCLTSEQVLAEVMTADPELYQRYLSVRIPFYEGLAHFIVQDIAQKGNDSVYSPSDLKGCYDAISFSRTQQDTELIEVNEIGKSSLLGAIDARKTRETKELDEAKLEAKLKAELKRESSVNAAEFIKLMRQHHIPMVDLFTQERTEVSSRDTGARDYDRRAAKIYEYTYDVTNILVGKGWVTKESGWGGYVLLSNGKTYKYYGTSFNEPGTNTVGDTYRRFSGPSITKDALRLDGLEPLESPYAGEDISLLVDTIFKLGIDSDSLPSDEVNS